MLSYVNVNKIGMHDKFLRRGESKIRKIYIALALRKARKLHIMM